jgi:hypothetical protein|tara:strand:+ start:150 stop:494 length:345 start_codon:yes stop_codon:yes gene_type:complete
MVCISIILWINWRKIGYPLIILIIISLAVISFGSGKLLNESIKFNLPAFNSSLSISSLDDDSQFLSRGKKILNSLRGWSKQIRGKKPIYSTDNGSQIIVDSIGEEKSIKIIKNF